MYDLGGGLGDYNATGNEQRLQGYRPVLRDTSFLYRYNTTDEDVDMGNAYTVAGLAGVAVEGGESKVCTSSNTPDNSRRDSG